MSHALFRLSAVAFLSLLFLLTLPAADLSAVTLTPPGLLAAVAGLIPAPLAHAALLSGACSGTVWLLGVFADRARRAS